MPIPAPLPNDDYHAAAIRHFNDALLLLDQGRYDNAVYLAGYVQECAIKDLLVHRLSGSRFAGKDISHVFHLIGAEGLAFLTASTIPFLTGRQTSDRGARVIAEGHPDRRFWPENWSLTDADAAVGQARCALTGLVFDQRLNDGRSPLP
jgi:HEPN domain-containing protein